MRAPGRFRLPYPPIPAPRFRPPFDIWTDEASIGDTCVLTGLSFGRVLTFSVAIALVVRQSSASISRRVSLFCSRSPSPGAHQFSYAAWRERVPRGVRRRGVSTTQVMTYFSNTSVRATCACAACEDFAPASPGWLSVRGHPCLKLRYGFGVIAPANLAFASGENERCSDRKPRSFDAFLTCSGILCSETADSVRSGFCHRFPSHLDCRSVEKRGRRCVAHFATFRAKVATFLPSERRNFGVRNTRSVATTFMFQYVCPSLKIRLHSITPLTTPVEESRFPPTFCRRSVYSRPRQPKSADLRSTNADFWYFCRMRPPSV